jgi:hypothetical protein
MRVATLIHLFLIFSHTEKVFANNTCPNLTGKYHSTWDTEDAKTEIIYKQSGCELLVVNGFTLYKYASSLNYGLVSASLDGKPPITPSYIGPVPGVLASYVAESGFIVKTRDADNAGYVSNSHGVCYFKISQLSKDVSGNLLEQPKDPSCQDGFTGTVEPLVFQKAD